MHELPTECVTDAGEEKGSETSMRFVSNGEVNSHNTDLYLPKIVFKISLFVDYVDLVYGEFFFK